MAGIADGLFAGRAGIQAHGTAISVLADNISNSNTVAYKASRTEFSDLVSGNLQGGGTSLQAGSGSSATGITSLFNQGSFEITGRGLDLGINGSGFFILEDAGARFYSRAGNFRVDEQGNILNQNGLNVLGFPANGQGGLESLNVATVTQDNIETENANFAGNFDASSPVTAVPGAPTFASLTSNSTFSTFVDVFDSLGASHTVSLFAFKTGPNAFTVNGYVDAGEVGGAAGSPSLIGTTNMTFNADGTLAAGGTFTANPIAWSNGSAAGDIDFDLTAFTQFSSPSSVNSVTQDGEGAGNIIAFNVDSQGNLFAQLDNGQNTVIGALALATFASPEGLGRVGGSLFIEGSDSGEPVVGTPGVGQFGSIEAGALELSTADIGNDFIKLITLQRGFQGSSRIITSIDELLNEIINLA